MGGTEAGRIPAGMTTNLWLPMADSHTVVAKLMQVFPSESLVFLRRIRRVTIISQLDTLTFSMKSSVSDHSCTVVSSSLAGSVSRKFFIVADDESSVKLAFPDPVWFGSEAAMSDESKARSFPVCTYLPVVDVGLPFILQGAFQLTANRENVHQDMAENLVLRNRVCPLFARAVHLFPQIQENLFLFVPTAVHSVWWRSLSQQLRQVVQTVAKIKCFDDEFRAVGRCIAVPEFVLAVFPPKIVFQGTSLFAVHTSVRSEAIDVFGCKELTKDQFLRCLSEATVSSSASRGGASWYERLYEALAEYALEGEDVDLLLTLPIFCNTDEAAFSASASMPLLSSEDELCVSFGASVPILHPSSYSTPRARLFLSRLGFTKNATDDEIADCIIAWHRQVRGSDLTRREATWMCNHIDWLSQHRTRFKIDTLTKLLCLPAKNVAQGKERAIEAVAVNEVFLSFEKLSVPVQNLVHKGKLWLLQWSGAKMTDAIKSTLNRLNVLTRPPLVRDLSSQALVPGPLLAEILDRVVDEAALQGVLELLFQEWFYYRECSELLVQLQSLGAPVSSTVEDNRLPWHSVFLDTSAEKDTKTKTKTKKKQQQQQDPLYAILPTLNLSRKFIAELSSWSDIVKDLGLKSLPLSEATIHSVSALLHSSACVDILVWTSYYSHAQRIGAPPESMVFISADSLLPVVQCVWEADEVVSRWTQKGGRHQGLSKLYPAELKGYFDVPACHTINDISKSLFSIWMDEKQEFRTLTLKTVEDAVYLYRLADSRIKESADQVLKFRPPVLRKGGAKSKWVFVGPSGSKAVLSDEPKLSRAVRLPKFFEAHEVFEDLPAVCEAMSLPVVSKLARQRPAGRTWPSLQLTLSYRAAFEFLAKASMALGAEASLINQLYYIRDHLTLYTVKEGRVKINVQLVVDEIAFSGDGQIELPHFWDLERCTLVVPEKNAKQAMKSTFKKVLESLGEPEAALFARAENLLFFDSTLPGLERQLYAAIGATIKFEPVADLGEGFAPLPSRSKERLDYKPSEDGPKGGHGKGGDKGDGNGIGGRDVGSGPFASERNGDGFGVREYESGESVGHGENYRVETDDDVEEQSHSGFDLARVEGFLGSLDAGASLEMDSAPSGGKSGGVFGMRRRIDFEEQDLRLLSTLENEHLQTIGRASEQLVHQWLCKEFGASSVRWLSRFAGECGVMNQGASDELGFDILLNVESSKFCAALDSSVVLLGESNSPQLQIEVKGHLFEADYCAVSRNELDVMAKIGDAYAVVLVSLTSKKITQVWLNPHLLIEQGQVSSKSQNAILKALK